MSDSDGPSRLEDDLPSSSPMQTPGAEEASNWMTRYASAEGDSDTESDDFAYETGAIEEVPSSQDAPDNQTRFEKKFKSSLRAVRQGYVSFCQCDKVIDTASVSIDQAYKDIIHMICDKTDTLNCEAVVIDAVPGAVAATSVSALLKRLASGPFHRMVSAFVVCIWLMVCSVYHARIQLTELCTTPITRLCACYWLLAESIINRTADDTSRSDISHENMILAWQCLLKDSLLRNRPESSDWLASLVPRLDDLANAAPPAPMRNDETMLYMSALNRADIMHLAWELVKDKSMSQISGIRDYIQKEGLRASRVVHQRIWLTLAGIDQDILKSLINGRLSQDYCSRGSSVRRALESTSHSRPGIYVNCIADELGVPPSPAHWEAVCDVMQTYLATKRRDREDEVAKLIDRAVSPSQDWEEQFADDGKRRYLDPAPRSLSQSSFIVDDEPTQAGKPRRKKVQTFITNMRARMKREGREQTKPMHHAVVEVGYATDPRKRLRSHLDHVSSNYLMNLAEATFQYLYHDRFQLMQFVIFNCWQPEQCWLGEIIVTQLGQGYTKDGYGFNYHPAGTSNGNAFSKRVDPRIWLQYEQEMLRDQDFMDLLARSRQRYEEFGRDCEQQVERLKALDLRLKVAEALIEYTSPLAGDSSSS